jgi:hypothetical protein
MVFECLPEPIEVFFGFDSCVIESLSNFARAINLLGYHDLFSKNSSNVAATADVAELLH